MKHVIRPYRVKFYLEGAGDQPIIDMCCSAGCWSEAVAQGWNYFGQSCTAACVSCEKAAEDVRRIDIAMVWQSNEYREAQSNDLGKTG